MRYNSAGINIDSVDKLILDIYNYAEKINKTLNQLSDVIDQTKNYSTCDEVYSLRKKFEIFKTNFSIINKNILSYSEDLIKLKNKFQNVDQELTRTMKIHISKVQDIK